VEPAVRRHHGTPGAAHALDAALLYLKHAYALSDEDVVQRWCENPYWQHFSGERYFIGPALEAKMPPDVPHLLSVPGTPLSTSASAAG
jgi:hypothetical protein